MNQNEIIFFKDILRMSDKEFLEIRILNIPKQFWFSKYVKTISKLETILKQFDTPDYNIYYGTNVRPTEGRKVVDIQSRKFFYYDLEHESNKPPITDESYKKELLETAHYIIVQLNKQYGIKPVVIYVSGRGIHLGYSHYDLDMSYDSKFKMWYKQTQVELDKKKPIQHIKFLDPTRDAARIGGCPGTINYKYPEKPLREIIQIKPENICDMQNILDNFKTPELKFKKFSIKKGNWNEKNIFEAPEFKVFELKVPEMRGFNVHSRLRVALILFMDLYGIENREEVAQRIVDLGYWYEPMTPINDPNYIYNTSIIVHWVFEHWEFCLEKGFKLPYHVAKNKVHGALFKDDIFDWDVKELKSVWDIYYYAKNFNNANCKYLGGDRIVFYPDALAYNVFKNVSDDKLIEWIKQNDFIKEVKVLR